jgi:hypothetical protein
MRVAAARTGFRMTNWRVPCLHLRRKSLQEETQVPVKFNSVGISGPQTEVAFVVEAPGVENEGGGC